MTLQVDSFHSIRLIMKKARFDIGKTQKKIAEEIGVAKRSIHLWENEATSIPLNKTYQIIKAYQIKDGDSFIELMEKAHKDRDAIKINRKSLKELKPRKEILVETPIPVVFRG